MRRNLLLALFLPLFLISFTQTNAQRNCAAMDHMHNEEQSDPHVHQIRQQIEAHTQAYVNNTDPDSRVNGIITIPVVVHVIYGNSTENISDAQIASQMQVLNDDFRRLNADADNTWSQAADTEIEFCMATIDPNGNPTNGITRTSTSVSAFSTNDAMKFNAQGGKDAWPAGDYLNMWVCDISGGILGYAQFPGGSAATDGVVMDYQYFGTIGTATAPFDGGRTTTHEVGHWLNLRHIWGDGNCNADDFVSDTPTSDAANYGCATGHVSCNSTDMVQNYMDYSDDGCMNLFTAGQTARMRALFDNGGFRQSLLNSGACGGTNPNPPTCVDGIQNGDETGVDCGGPDCPDCPTCSDGIQNGNETGVDCGGPDCNVCPCNGTNINITINFDNYPEETSWTLVDGNGTQVGSGGTYDTQPDGSSISLVGCLPDDCYTFTINDAYGDGICCSYGNGSYSIVDEDSGTTLASGGQFGASEATQFCLGNQPTCSDGEQNGNETGVDCGGPDCPACPPTCTDGEQNGDEEGVDCGGSSCQPCPDCAAATGLIIDDSNGIRLDWDDVADADVYNVNVYNQAGVLIINGFATTNSELDLGNSLSPCTSDNPNNFYYYEVETVCTNGLGSTSNTLQFDVQCAAPDPCTNGVQDAGEEGIDCGGNCPNACPPPPPVCTEQVINFNDFESNWGIWNDGGSDCARNISTVYSIGERSMRLRDNSSSSVCTTDALNLTAYDDLTVDFSYICRSMDNSSEDFWLQISTNGGGSYTTVEEWNRGDEFENGVRYYETVTIQNDDNFTSNMKIRFRCDASGNQDWVYIDNVTISGCLNSARQEQANVQLLQEVFNPTVRPDFVAGSKDKDGFTAANITVESLFPNPTSDVLNVKFDLATDSDVQFTITDLTGKTVFNTNKTLAAGKQTETLDVNRLGGGYYLLVIQTGDERIVKKFVSIR